jgi:hypothetical protein
MRDRLRPAVGALLLSAATLMVLFDPVAAQTPAAGSKPWAAPRTPDGKPDLQGNWTNETQTPLERIAPGGATLTSDQAAAIEDRARFVEAFRDKPSDPNRGVPPVGGDNKALTAPGEASFIERIAEIAGGQVGGYNGFWTAACCPSAPTPARRCCPTTSTTTTTPSCRRRITC